MSQGEVSKFGISTWECPIDTPQKLKFFIRNWEIFYAKKWNFKHLQTIDSDIVDGGKELLDEIVINSYDNDEKQEYLHGDKIVKHFENVRTKINKTNKENEKISQKEQEHDKMKQINKLQN